MKIMLLKIYVVELAFVTMPTHNYTGTTTLEINTVFWHIFMEKNGRKYTK